MNNELKKVKVIDLIPPVGEYESDTMEIAIDPDPNDEGKMEPDTWREIDFNDFLMTDGIDGDYNIWFNMSIPDKLEVIQKYVDNYIEMFKKLPPISQGS